MNKIINKLIKHLAEKQKTLFLIDSLGAILTVFSLIVMREWNEYFGMPKNILKYLSVLTICFCIYSTLCFFLLKDRWIPFIRIIGIANLLYCALTFGLLIKYYPLLTIIGTLYFLIEIIIILGLSYVELNMTIKIRKRNYVENRSLTVKKEQ